MGLGKFNSDRFRVYMYFLSSCHVTLGSGSGFDFDFNIGLWYFFLSLDSDFRRGRARGRGRSVYRQSELDWYL